MPIYGGQEGHALYGELCIIKNIQNVKLQEFFLKTVFGPFLNGESMDKVLCY